MIVLELDQLQLYLFLKILRQLIKNNNIENLGLDEDIIEKFMKIALKPSRVAKVGRIDLKQKKTKDLIMEGSENFQTDSDHPVASLATTNNYKTSSSEYGGSIYGVNSHKSKPKEDNWNCRY